VDSSAPTIDATSSNGTQVQASTVSPVDVLDVDGDPVPSITFRNGNPVVLSFTATDAGPAGIDVSNDDGTDLSDDLTLVATNGGDSSTLSDWTATAVEDALTGVVTFTVTLDVPVTATNGVYTVTASVLDRSGNESATADLGDFQIANELLATVQLQGFTGGLRDVTFVATGGTAKTWVKTVDFGTGDTGTVSLEDVPNGTTGLSAKTAWNLRSKVAVAFSGTGVGTADFTGADQLPGGDLNGDNVVNTLDYSILRFNWFETAPIADIDGNGPVNTTDYNILQLNFYTAGDAE
jgi:hypothetical protein